MNYLSTGGRRTCVRNEDKVCRGTKRPRILGKEEKQKREREKNIHSLIFYYHLALIGNLLISQLRLSLTSKSHIHYSQLKPTRRQGQARQGTYETWDRWDIVRRDKKYMRQEPARFSRDNEQMRQDIDETRSDETKSDETRDRLEKNRWGKGQVRQDTDNVRQAGSWEKGQMR